MHDRSPHPSLPTSQPGRPDEETGAQSQVPSPSLGATLTASGLGLVRAVGTLLLAIALPPLSDAVAVVTGEVAVRTGLLGCGAREKSVRGLVGTGGFSRTYTQVATG